jgi:CDP-glycerol glycerophosphotransferase
MAATLGRDAQKWDFLISANEHSTAVFRRAFEYDGRVLETGYPRNDVLFSPDAGDIRVETRRRLGVDEASTLVLYAPTWRDDITDDRGRPRFSPILELEALVAALPSHTVMARLHHMLEPGSLATSPRVMNVSDYADIADLYLAADVLITDYSSVMFDFAITRKPMVFFVPDMEHYGNSTRGFYFDLSTCAPGPLCTTTEDVIDALREPQAVRRSYQAAAESFRRTFCPWDDGTVSVRVVDAVFGPA